MPSASAWPSQLDRWTNWACNFRRCHERITRRAQGLRFILARTAAGIVQQINRWHRTVFATRQTIRLSIGPLIFQTENRGAFRALQQHAPMRFHWPWLSPAPAEIKELPAINAGKSREKSESAVAAGGGVPTAHGERRSGAFFDTPMNRVFARAAAAEGEPSSCFARHEVTNLRQTVKLVEHTDRRRVEQLQRRLNLTLGRREVLTKTINQIQQETVFESPHVRQAGSRALAAVHETAAAFDLDQLTDRVVRNIDSRIIAHRERMGRVF